MQNILSYGRGCDSILSCAIWATQLTGSGVPCQHPRHHDGVHAPGHIAMIRSLFGCDAVHGTIRMPWRKSLFAWPRVRVDFHVLFSVFGSVLGV